MRFEEETKGERKSVCLLPPPEDKVTYCDEIMLSHPHHLLSKPMPTSSGGGREPSLLQPAQGVTKSPSPTLSPPPTTSHRLAVPSIGDGPGTVTRVTLLLRALYPPWSRKVWISQGSHSWGGNHLRSIIKIEPPGSHPPELCSWELRP